MWKVYLVLFAGITLCFSDNEESATPRYAGLLVSDGLTTGVTETMTTNTMTCQEGPEEGLPPTNEICDCGEENYFYGNFCQFINLTAANDINTSKRVMEIQWEVFPNFTREYIFVYRKFASIVAPSSQQLILNEGLGYFFAWLTYLESGEVSYVVCVMDETLAGQTIDDVDGWETRIDDVTNDDCVKIQTDVSITQEMTFAAVVIAAGMGTTLIVVFIANLVVNRQKEIRTIERENRGSKRVERTRVLSQNMNTDYYNVGIYDDIVYSPDSSGYN